MIDETGRHFIPQGTFGVTCDHPCGVNRRGGDQIYIHYTQAIWTRPLGLGQKEPSPCSLPVCTANNTPLREFPEGPYPPSLETSRRICTTCIQAAANNQEAIRFLADHGDIFIRVETETPLPLAV
jgi:hypothetical protein